MKKIFRYIKEYLADVDAPVFTASSIFLALLIAGNYGFRWSDHLYYSRLVTQYACWFAIFISAFGFAYCWKAVAEKKNYFSNKLFLFFFIAAPLIFTWKICADIELIADDGSARAAYINRILYFPCKLIVIVVVLYFFSRLSGYRDKIYGLTFQNFSPAPYLIMLLIMMPLIALASTQRDFLMTYPKLFQMEYLSLPGTGFIYKLIYELSYGCDFISIELFFRGFLILGFVKWCGKDAILPMAMFYCTIHFGKPLGECISSFFGGLLLGIVTVRTGSIVGGLIVHLGIAWMMELGGYIGRQWM